MVFYLQLIALFPWRMLNTHSYRRHMHTDTLKERKMLNQSQPPAYSYEKELYFKTVYFIKYLGLSRVQKYF